MSPIRVQCETCNTRLRVRDPGFIGEVHACPRCGGMVLITAPAAVEHEAPATESADPIPRETPDPLPLDETPPAASSELDREAFAEETESTARGAGYAKALAPAITATALVASAGLLWIAYGPSASAPTESAEASETLLSGPIATPTIVEAAPEATPDATEGAEAVIPPSTPEPRPVTPNEAAPVEPVTDEEQATEFTLPDAAPIRDASTEAAQDPESPASAPELPDEIDPLDFDPATIDLVLKRGGAPSEALPVVPRQASPAAMVPPTVPEAIDKRLALAARVGGISVRRGPSSDETNRPPTTPAHELLAAKLPAIDLQNVPLIEAVDLLAELAGAPITLAPRTLLHAGVDVRRELDVSGDDLAITRLIGDALRPVRLELRHEGPQAWLARVGSDEVRSVSHRVGDLAGDRPEEFYALLEAVGPTGVKLPVAGGGERLPLEARGTTHYDLLLLCERLRVARGQPTQTKYPRRMLQTEPSLRLLAKTLERRTTFSFVEPTPLRDVVAHWRRATGLVVLVDWRALGEAGLGPCSTLECAVTNRPWSEALDGVLAPLGLGWAAVDETLWITSLDSLGATPLVEFYPVARARGDAFANRLADRISAAGVAYDEPGGVAIVRGDAAAQRTAHEFWGKLSEAP